jgi:phage gp45-like
MGLTKATVDFVAQQIAGVRRSFAMLARPARLTSIDATGTSTRVGVSVSDFEPHEEVELLEPYGVTSNPPVGSKVLLLCSGGDGGHPIALMAGQPSVRLSGLASGEVAIHVGAGAGGGTGARIVLRANGNIEVNPGPAATVRVVPSGAAAPLAVARATDPVLLNATDIGTLNTIIAAWTALQPAGGPLVVPPATPIVPVTGAGTITAGGTGMVST